MLILHLMKIEPIKLVVRIGSEESDILPIDHLRSELNHACYAFLNDSKKDVLVAAKNLAINQKIALQQFASAMQAQQFANDINNANTTALEKEIKEFTKQFNDLIK